MEQDKKFLILIVDDNFENLQVLGSSLQTVGYTLTLAPSGTIALDFLKKKKPDLILLDIMMPEIDGYEVCKIIKSNDETKDIPIIFLTAKTDVDNIVKGFEYGAVDYITKPFNKKELLIRVSTHLELKNTKDKLIQKMNELKFTKEQLVQKVVELDLANQTKDKFFSIIAHDLSNLFGSFINLMEMWKFYKNGYPEDKFVKTLNSIQSSARTGYELLVNLLDWSRTQTGKIDFKLEKLNLKHIIEENFVLLESNANKKNINLVMDISEGVMINADRNMINTVIRNLISNAIKFTLNGGKIEIISEVKKNFVEIIVKDNGIGMEEEDIKKLFRIDTKHRTLGTNDEKGTGLGLNLCKEFINKHGGKIWVNSIPNIGSQFFISLPHSLNGENQHV
ncbi:MAG: hybrid sensor histidine kinase/response regulator [Leptospiraceae bacterium]|nr:hybrid sensor histidine kinase/response regulator [Leptospiraceae bacterium]MCP5496910.1 hybrid sensor histidine kinase/response regulator [Leptospiraceae bacterium]